jgi:hypothetical protein
MKSAKSVMSVIPHYPSRVCATALLPSRNGGWMRGVWRIMPDHGLHGLHGPGEGSPRHRLDRLRNPLTHTGGAVDSEHVRRFAHYPHSRNRKRHNEIPTHGNANVNG